MFFDNAIADIAARGAILSAAGLVWVVALVRITGLRSFSKMTNFDFVMTVATGSLLAGAAQAGEWSGFGQALAAMTALFAAQYLVAKVRKSSGTVEKIIQNDAVLLMRNGEFCREAMADERVSESDVVAKLREANVLEMAKVRAVVLETTGDISVLHGEVLEDRLITDVRSVK